MGFQTTLDVPLPSIQHFIPMLPIFPYHLGCLLALFEILAKIGVLSQKRCLRLARMGILANLTPKYNWVLTAVTC